MHNFYFKIQTKWDYEYSYPIRDTFVIFDKDGDGTIDSKVLNIIKIF